MRRSSPAGALVGVLVFLGLPACASFEASSEGSELVASADGTSLRMLLPLSGVVGDCILVDDAALYEPK